MVLSLVVNFDNEFTIMHLLWCTWEGQEP